MSLRFARLAFAFVSCAALWSRPATAAPVWSDPLTGSQIDTVHWAINTGWFPPNPDVTLAPSSTGVLVSIASAAHDPIFSAGIASLCSLVGDFDVQVDYQLGPWPGHSGARIGLVMGASNPSAAFVFDCDIERDSLSATGDVLLQNAWPTPGGEVYIAAIQIQSQPYPDVTTADMQGTMRLTRTGNTETALFAAAGGAWTTVYTAANTSVPVFPGLGAWSRNGYRSTPGGGSSVLFRNFTVNSGQLNCPDAGAPDAGNADSGATDAGAPDASPQDATAGLDGGSTDGAATSSSDAGAPDASPQDAAQDAAAIVDGGNTGGGGGKSSSSGCSCNLGSRSTSGAGGGLLSLAVLAMLRRRQRARVGPRSYSPASGERALP